MLRRAPGPPTRLGLAVVAALLAGGPRARADEPFSATARVNGKQDPSHHAQSRVTRRDLEERLPRSAPDALKYEPGVSVQQTAHGQASPFVRAMTGQQVLLQFDGVRLNNGLFRQGPNQYFFTVDALTLDHLDVIRGSASTEYGSDAIGGVIVAVPIDTLSALEATGPTLRPRVIGRFASQDLDRGGRAEVLLSPDPNTGLRLGAGYREVDRLEGGGVVRNPGERAPWVPRLEADGRTQIGTGFREATFDARLEHAIDADLRFVGALYGYRQMDAPRTDQCPPPEARIEDCLTFDHQDRTLAYAAVRGDVGEALKEVDVTLSWQGHSEDRRLEIPGAFVRTDSENRVSTLGVVARAASPWSRFGTTDARIRFGGDVYRDGVGSTEAKTFTDVDRTRLASRGQYVDGSSYLQAGAFGIVEARFADRVTVSGGGRAVLVAARSPGDEASGTAPVAREWGAAVAHAGVAVEASPELTLALNYDQGFRAPNLDDLTARQQVGPGFQFENASLDPERSHTFELGPSIDLDWLALDVWGFAMLLDDAISRAVREATDCPAGTPNCGSARDQLQLVNAPGTTLILGTEGGATIFLPWDVTLRGTYSYAWGEQDNTGSREGSGQDFYGARVPLSRVPPLQGTVELRWRHNPSGFYAGAAWRWALAQTRLAPSDLADARIPYGGTPGYSVFDLRAGYRYRDKIRVSLVFENVLDEAYRIHGSSINGPGRGLLLTTSVGF